MKLNKPLIKVFKRRIKFVAETQNNSEPVDSSLKAARHAKREIVKTITGWVNERREQNQLAEIIARQEIFGKLLTIKGQ